MDLHVFWFVMIGVLLAGYAVLDGFDLGVGVVHLLVRGDEERRLVLNSIGPLWDGNEVWLVTFGGALFAAFPVAYATVLSSFYLPFVVLLACLIGRAISIEFRSKRKERGWRSYWDVSFALSSTLALFLMGVTVGNALYGIPLDGESRFVGSLAGLLGPYPVSVGLFTVVGAAMHGAIYLAIKTEGAVHGRAVRIARVACALFIAGYLAITAATLFLVPHATANFERWPGAWFLVALNLAAVSTLPVMLKRGALERAFAASAVTLVLLVTFFGLALFPALVVSSLDRAGDLTIYNACSSEGTLSLMRWIALLGMPFVVAYTSLVYWVFRGKTKLDTFSY